MYYKLICSVNVGVYSINRVYVAIQLAIFVLLLLFPTLKALEDADDL